MNTDVIHQSAGSNFRGAFTALVTPFTADAAHLDIDRLRANIQYQAAGRVRGVVPCGTTGESPTLSEQEHRIVVQKTIEFARPLGLSVIAGAGSNSTAHAVRLHRFAQGAGADASLQVVPYYNKPSQEGLYGHFMSIADSCELPIVLYNIPGRCGVGLAVATIQRLAEHPNIRAIKDATGDLEMASEIASSTNLALLSGDDTLTLPVATVGGVGVISVASNLLPALVATLCAATLDGRWDEARGLHDRLFTICRTLLKTDTNPVPIKTALAMAGRDTGAVRLPLAPPSDHAVADIRRSLAAFGRIDEGLGIDAVGAVGHTAAPAGSAQ